MLLTVENSTGAAKAPSNCHVQFLTISKPTNPCTAHIPLLTAYAVMSHYPGWPTTTQTLRVSHSQRVVTNLCANISCPPRPQPLSPAGGPQDPVSSPVLVQLYMLQQSSPT